MSDMMWSFGWGRSGSTPAWLLRQQKKAIKQAGKKLQEIDKLSSTKALKDDIKAETLLTQIPTTPIILGTTVGGIIKTSENQIILINDKRSWRGFPKWWMEAWESEIQTLYREIEEETWIQEKDLQFISKLGQYLGYSNNHKGDKQYIWYLLEVNSGIKLSSQEKNILEIAKFDIIDVLSILNSEHQKLFWKEQLPFIQ